jgi:putative pyoverdin transport system ATP-binding/permease protein
LIQMLFIMPQVARADVALDKLDSLKLELEGSSPPPLALTPLRSKTFSSILLDGACHSYTNDADDRVFTLGPLNLTLRPAEIVFVVGGNGSGKTTFAKMLTGLYRPSLGQIVFDGGPVTDENLEQYMSLFSAVFSDFFLFPDLHGLAHTELDERSNSHLAKLKLEKKVTVENGVLSTTLLSAGQRKRLALVVAYIEDRPVVVFDEWAADQDPEFKNYFYTKLLPELKAAGKCVFVISHDDRYFHVADRVLHLNEGKLTEQPPLARMEGA